VAVLHVRTIAVIDFYLSFQSFASVSVLGEKLRSSATNFKSKLVLNILDGLPNLDELVADVKKMFTVDNGMGGVFSIAAYTRC
jgi:hypothetical protein